MSIDPEAKPFLLRYAEKTGSPPGSEIGSKYYFDPEDDMLHSKEHAGNPPAIELDGESGPRTKKNDVEKGDDNKDRGIWL